MHFLGVEFRGKLGENVTVARLGFAKAAKCLALKFLHFLTIFGVRINALSCVSFKARESVCTDLVNLPAHGTDLPYNAGIAKVSIL